MTRTTPATLSVSDLLTVEQAAAQASISLSTLYRHIAAGDVATHRVLGRLVLDRHDVERLCQLRARRSRRCP